MDKFFSLYEDAEEQKNSKLILYGHCALKGGQVGSAVGAVVGTLFLVLRSRSGMITKLSNTGLIVGPFASMGVCYSQMLGEEKIGWQDRAWRLQRNVNQVNIDRWTEGSLLAALVFAKRFSGPSVAVGLLAGAASNNGYLDGLHRQYRSFVTSCDEGSIGNPLPAKRGQGSKSYHTNHFTTTGNSAPLSREAVF